MGNFDHKAFISYSHLDKPWAEKLAESLEARGYKDVFLDSEHLHAGRDWNKALLKDLVNSEHLIVIYSSNSKSSEWVNHERGRFESERDEDHSRLIIHIELDAQTEVFAATQNIQLGVKPDQIDTLEAERWNDVMARIVETFELETGAKFVRKLVLTSTLPRLQQISLYHTPLCSPPFRETLEAIGMKQRGDESDAWKQKLAAVYGAARSDWRPFGGAQRIGGILDDLKVGIEAQKGAPRFVWRDVDDRFWGNQEQMNAALAELAGNLTLVIVDPMSLYDEHVRARCEKVRYRLMDERTVISVLAPFPISPLAVHLRKLIKGSAEELYDVFYSPPFSAATALAHVNVCALDHLDVQRLLGTVLRADAVTTTAKAAFVKTNTVRAT